MYTQEGEPVISVDQLLAIKSMVGSEAPRWMPDGAEHRICVRTRRWRRPLEHLAGGRQPGLGFPSAWARWVTSPTSCMRRRPMGSTSPTSRRRAAHMRSGSGRRTGQPDRQITRLGGAIESLAWAPDGSAVVISANRYGVYDIYRVDVSRWGTHRLTSAREL